MKKGTTVSVKKTPAVINALINAGSGGEIWQRNVASVFRNNKATGVVTNPPSGGIVEVAVVGLPQFYGKGFGLPIGAISVQV